MKILGIDLGTTNSCVAIMDEGGIPRVLAAADGTRTTASVVAFTDDATLIGMAALRQAVTNPSRTILGAKRLIGRKVNCSDVSWLARSAPYQIVAAANGDAWVRIDQQSKSPEEIASHILKRMKEIAAEAVGELVTQAVVTVPAYFDDAQRQATRDASAIAGLDVIRILNEPTAAALAFGAHRVKDGRRVIAVFDLGGGTFDISVMAVEDDIFEVLATNGDSALGGDDWDRMLIGLLADEIFDEHHVDITGSPVAMSRLKESCERAKCILSSESETEINLPYLCQCEAGDALHFVRRVKREELEKLTTALIERLKFPCRQALADAKIEICELEDILLVGGMSRWPAVVQMVKEFFQREPSKGANPDEVVALGAAGYGAILGGAADDAALLDVTPHTIGIRVGETGFAPIIPRNSMLPVRKRKLFATSHDDQEFVSVEVYQGESPQVQDNRCLGRITLDHLPPGKAGSVRVELILTVDVESIVHVAARELASGAETSVSLAPSGGLTEAQLGELVAARRSDAMIAIEEEK